MAGLSFNPSYGTNAQGQYDYNGVSQDPALATNWFPSEAAAQNAWFAANPSYAADNTGTSASGPNLTASAPTGQGNVDPNNPYANLPAQPNINFDPNWLTNFLPGGSQAIPNVPQTTAYGINPNTIPGIIPSTINAPTIPNAPQVGTSTITPGSLATPNAINAPTVGTPSVNAATSNIDLSNPALAQQIYSGLQPQFKQQDQALTEQLANSGIVGGSSIGAQGMLGLQQQNQFMAALAPLTLQQEGLNLNQSQANQNATNQVNLQNAANTLSASGQNAQLGYNTQAQNISNLLNQGQFNINTGMTAQQQNAQNQLAASQANAGNAINVGGQNAQNALSASGQNAQLGLTAQEQAATNALNLGQYNAGVQNATNQYNTSNILNAAGNQAQQANAAQTLQAQLGNQDWLTQYQAQQALIAQKAGAGASAFQPNYYAPPAVNYGFNPISSTPAAQPSYTPATTLAPYTSATGTQVA